MPQTATTTSGTVQGTRDCLGAAVRSGVKPGDPGIRLTQLRNDPVNTLDAAKARGNQYVIDL